MGLLDFLFGKPIEITDSFFGKMTFMEIKKIPENNYFECGRHFEPTDDYIEIGIAADVTGPTEKQKDFFKYIETEFDELIPSFIQIIEDEFKNWKEDFRIVDFKKEFKAVYLFLPRCESEPNTWEISFDTIHDENHSVSLTMKDNSPTEILIDG